MNVLTKVRSAGTGLVLLFAMLVSLPAPLFGQLTTGTVSGLAADATGAIIPHATAVLTNVSNNTTRTTKSDSKGYFVFASVESSLNYKVEVSMQGFRSWESRQFPLRPGDQVNFTDVKLQVGDVQEQVTVEAATNQAVKPLDSSERSDTITAEDLKTLSIVGRDATELVRMLPGFSPQTAGVNNQPNYNAAVVGLSGPTGSFSANGTGTNGIAVVQDGVSLQDISTNGGTVQEVNSDAVEEIKVSSAFDAESAKGPTVVNAITKSGTSAFHGSLYLYARDTALNSNDWYNNYLRQTRPDGQYFYPGGTVGGPILLPFTKFNRQRNKLFFFFQYEATNQLFSPATLGSWTPTLAERQGDFSAASLNTQLCGARPDGAVNPNAIQPMCQAENYLPNGNAVSNGNVAAYKNASGAALLNWLPLPNADPFTNASGYNLIQVVEQQQNGSLIRAKIDYSINETDKLSLTYGRQAQIAQQPVNFGYIPAASALYPGGVTTGDISNIGSITYTKVIGARFTNEATLAQSYVSQPGNESTPAAASRYSMNSYNGGNGNFNYLGEYKNGGDGSVPALSDYGNYGYPQLLMPGGFYNNQVRLKKVVPNFQDVLTYVKGKHVLKTGIYLEERIINGLADFGSYPQGEFTFNPNNSYYEYSATVGQNAQFTNCETPNSAGTSRNSGASYLGQCMNPNALMYLGYADTYTQTNFSPVVDMNSFAASGFVNDTWKIRHFTLNLGVRLEHLGPWSDRHNNGLAEFSPSLYAQQCNGRTCGSTNAPGVTWHSQDASVLNSVNQPATVYASPRLGMSWDIFGTGNTVLRGGWGIYRNEEEFNPYALAAATAQGYKTSFLQGQESFDLIDSTSPANPPDFTAYTLSPNDTARPLNYLYNAQFDQHLPWRSLLEIAYVGSNNQNLSTYNNGSYNGASNLNLIPAGGLFTANLGTIPANILAAQQGTGTNLSNLTTPETDVFRPYPFYANVYALKHVYYSSYNSLQVSWNKSSGRIQYGANYTFSKDLATAASYNNVIPDPLNLRNEYNPVPFDHTHVFNIHYLIDFGTRYRGSHELIGQVANGWQLSGISSLLSGPPLASLEGENFGFGYGQLAPTQLSYQIQTDPVNDKPCLVTYGITPDKNGNTYCTTSLNSTVWLGSPDYQLMPTVVCKPSGGPSTHQFINPACFGIPLPGGVNSANPTGQGQYRLPYIHGPASLSNDLTVLKNFPLRDKRNVQLRIAGFNFLNHPLVSFNNNDTGNLNLGGFQGGVAGQALTLQQITHQNFGIAQIKYGSRLIEVGAKYEF